MFNNQRGFTLVEMLIVLLVISVLLLLIIPNLTKQTDLVNDKGCQALVEVIQAQAQAYYLENGQHAASFGTLIDAGYLTEEQTDCGDGEITFANGRASWVK